ncbi:MAG: glutathionylspermidine synthase family protein [Alphaproteobacteria bacterium]|nr:glutathionylspermidine synthase family protein [Alphaproteobacteria bacterium]
MKRLVSAPRADWRERAERQLGFAFHTIDGKPYWDETAAYVFEAAEIDGIEEVTGELEQICLATVERIVAEGAYERLGLDEPAARLIEDSWRRGDRNLYGRFDLSYRPGQPPKLLEYNADTPTALFEASVVQWEWLQTVHPAADQFNSIHEKLVAAWRWFAERFGAVHFACVAGHAEDRGTIDYMRDAALQGGVDGRFLHIDEVGWDGRHFVDLERRAITCLFKLYPWEWLLRESFAAHIGPSGAVLVEPPWKMLLSNKAVLPLLYDMADGHPAVLPAALEPGAIEGPVVRKPILGREGANVTLGDAATPGTYGAEGFVYQAEWRLPEFDGKYPVIGSWVVASNPAGIGIREDDQPITLNTSRFVPHFFV